LHFKLRTGFFNRFPRGAFSSRFVQLHETCGQCPFAFAWLNIAFAQQYFVAPNRYGPDNVQRVFVMHGVASGTNSAVFGVTIVWLAVNHGSAAVFAVFDGRSVNHLRSL
jgi:hypothetical protein